MPTHPIYSQPTIRKREQSALDEVNSRVGEDMRRGVRRVGAAGARARLGGRAEKSPACPLGRAESGHVAEAPLRGVHRRPIALDIGARGRGWT